jgi:hypothetical protein
MGDSLRPSQQILSTNEASSMEVVLMVLALGAGGVYAVKRGRKGLRSAVGWTAEKAGFITGRLQETLAETTQIAKTRYEEGLAAIRDDKQARGETPSPRNGSIPPPSLNGTAHAPRAE